jgi:hypothetical protein
MSTVTETKHPTDYMWRIQWIQNDGSRRPSIVWYRTLDECSAAAHALAVDGRTFEFERKAKTELYEGNG